MNTRMIVLVVFALAASACSTVGKQHRTECTPGPNGPPKEIPITIVFTPKEIIDPQTRCARPGDVLRFQLKGKPNILVSVDSSDPGGEWLKGSGKIYDNHKKGVFWVSVPLTALPPEVEEKDFKYDITAGTIVLDPVVRVRHSY